MCQLKKKREVFQIGAQRKQRPDSERVVNAMSPSFHSLKWSASISPSFSVFFVSGSPFASGESFLMIMCLCLENIYLAALCVSCGSRDLCWVMWGLSLQCTDFLVVAQ